MNVDDCNKASQEDKQDAKHCPGTACHRDCR